MMSILLLDYSSREPRKADDDAMQSSLFTKPEEWWEKCGRERRSEWNNISVTNK
jgi:hypothetical protein